MRLVDIIRHLVWWTLILLAVSTTLVTVFEVQLAWKLADSEIRVL